MTAEERDEAFMDMALREASAAAARGEVPVGALVVAGDEILATGHNLRETLQDPSAHAEMIAIRRAAEARGSWRLPGTTLYVTLEPCVMCMGVALLARVDRVVFGAWDPKGGAAGSVVDLSHLPRVNHRLAVSGGVRERACADILSAFFADLRRTRSAGGRAGGGEPSPGPLLG